MYAWTLQAYYTIPYTKTTNANPRLLARLHACLPACMKERRKEKIQKYKVPKVALQTDRPSAFRGW